MSGTKTWGELLREFGQGAGLNLEERARALGYSQSYLCELEIGDKGPRHDPASTKK